MGNSTITLQNVVDDAATLGDVSPALATGGFSDGPALSIATDVMQALINGGPGGQPYNWKWNRMNVTAFPTNSWQQDYFVPGVVKVGWLETATAFNVNKTSIPKDSVNLEVRKDLEITDSQTGSPGKICWLPNDQLLTGVWGQHPLGPTAALPSGETVTIGPGLAGTQNPGPNVIYTNPIGLLTTPSNPTTAITDPNNNLWVLTTYGTCGSTQPNWPTNPTYPTYNQPNTTATTVTDGTCVWTAINPKGQGFRLNPIPPQTGIVWMIQPIAQMRAPRFTSLGQYLEPIPDDFEWAFKQGFFAECYRRNPDPKVRAKYPQELQWWRQSLDLAVRQSDREMDDYGFYPGGGVMDTGYLITPVNPANPFGPWFGRG